MSGTGGYDNRQGLNWMRGVKMRDDRNAIPTVGMGKAVE